MARVAGRQAGLVSVEQLRSAGLTEKQVRTRVSAGRLHRERHGVYAVGHRAGSDLTPLWRVLLRCGEDAKVTGEASLRLFGCWAGDDEPGDVHVLVPRPVRRAAGIRPHVTSDLRADEWTRRRGLPTTTPTRALLDLAAASPSAEELRAAVRRALVERRTSIPQLHVLVERHAGRRGVGRLRAIVDEGFIPTRSELENRVAALLRERRIDGWTANARVRVGDGRSFEVDFLFEAARVIVEADGRRYHDDPLSRAADEAKQAALEADGWVVLRVTWYQATRRRSETERRIRAALGERAFSVPIGR